MMGFYNSSWFVLTFITLILGLSVFAQSFLIVLKFYQKEKIIDSISEKLFEITILVEIFILSLLHGEIVNGYKNGIVVPLDYKDIRVSVFIFVLILAMGIYMKTKEKSPLYMAMISTIILPVFEKLLERAYPWFFIGLLIVILIRSIKTSINELKKIKTNITALSVLHGIDSLPTAILFCEKNGYTILSNYQMQKLMYLMTGKVYRNALEFYKTLTSDKYKSKYKVVELEGQKVYILPDESAWIIRKTKIDIKNKDYIHISATNVSESWALTRKLQCQEKELRKKSQELKKTISNLYILSKEKEIDKAKIRAHDILGQRLTVLLRMIQNEEVLDYELLKRLSRGLLEELKEDEKQISPGEKLENIKEIFNAIGVEIDFTGSLPEDFKKADLFIDIIREASTNAVRHGFAKLITIDSEKLENSYKLVIANIGHTSLDPIIPGGGIKAMKRKIEAQRGSLEIISYPKFILTAILPGGGESV